MLITRDYIFLAIPKTGSTFVRTVIKDSHLEITDNRFMPEKLKRHLTTWKLLPCCMEISRLNPGGSLSPHVHRKTLPDFFENRTIVAALRHPVSRFISLYRFQSWTRDSFTYPYAKFAPNYPEMSANELHHANMMHVKQKKLAFLNEMEIGWQSLKTIQFLSTKTFLERCQRERPEFQSSEELLEAFLEDIKDVKLLRQNHLSEDLLNLYQGKSNYERVAKSIEELGRVNETKHVTKAYEPHPIEDALLAQVEKDEWFLIEVMKRRGLLD